MRTGLFPAALYINFSGPPALTSRVPVLTVYLVNHNVFLVSKQGPALGHEQQCKQLKSAIDLTGSAAVLQMPARFSMEILVWASFACISAPSSCCPGSCFLYLPKRIFFCWDPSWRLMPGIGNCIKTLCVVNSCLFHSSLGFQISNVHKAQWWTLDTVLLTLSYLHHEDSSCGPRL